MNISFSSKSAGKAANTIVKLQRKATKTTVKLLSPGK